MKNMTNNILILACLVAVAKTATFSTAWIDTSKGEGVGFLVNLGLNTGTTADASNKVVVTMEESDTTASSAATAVDSSDILNAIPALDTDAEFGKNYRTDYIGIKRYVRLTFTWTGTPAAIMAVTGLVGTLKRYPAAAPAAATAAT